MTTKRNDWSRILKEYHRSNKPPSEFCRTRGLSVSALYQALKSKKYQEPETASGSGFIQLTGPTSTAKPSVRISLSNGRAICLDTSDSVDEKLLTRLIRLCESC